MSTEPLQEAPDSRTNLPRRRRPKQSQDRALSFSAPKLPSTSEASLTPPRRPSKTSTVARAARSMLGSGSGTSALESQLATDPADSRPYQPSLTRISEGRASDARDTGGALGTTRHRPRVVARSRVGRYPVENQRRLQERVRAALTSPSMQSVLSTLTSTTSSSSGSNSTLTQGSYARSDTMPREESRRSRHHSAIRQDRDRRRRYYRDSQKPPDLSQAEHLNVFSYLEGETRSYTARDTAWTSGLTSSSSSEDGATDDDGDDNDHQARERERIHRTYTPTSSSTHSSGDSPIVEHKPLRMRRQWTSNDQPHSDSGISVRGGSPDSVDQAKQPRVEAEEDVNEIEELENAESGDEREEEEEEIQEEDANENRDRHGNAPHGPSPAIPAANQAAEPDTPTAWQGYEHPAFGANSTHFTANQQPLPPQPPPYSHASLVPYAAPPPMQLAALDVPPPAPEPPLPPRARAAARVRKPSQPTGYDALATALSPSGRDLAPTLPPLYRRFERLNHRILLHLQDEIAEMEEALHSLDASIAHASSHMQHPASRRADARFGSDAHFARTELLGRIFMKLRDYNDALSGFRGALAAGPAAATEDIERYRARMQQQQPIAQNELRFLGAECEADLVRVASGPADPRISSQAVTSGAVERDAFGMVLLAVVACLAVAGCAFSYITHIVARLTLVAVLVGGAYVGSQRVSGGVEPERRALYLVGFALVLVCMAGATA